MGGVGVDGQFHWRFCGGHPGCEEIGVVSQVVIGAHRYQTGGQTGQVGEQGRHIGIASLGLGHARGERVDHDLKTFRVQDVWVAAVVEDRRGAPQVVPAEHQIGAQYPVDGAEAVSHPQQRGCGQMPPGRLTADEHLVGAPAHRSVLQHPGCGRLAVVGSRGVGVLGGQPVVHRQDGQPVAGGQVLIGRIAHLGTADNPAAAVDVQEHGPWLLRLKKPHRNVSARTRNGGLDRHG